jgi:lysophospholipase L1-like esterase
VVTTTSTPRSSGRRGGPLRRLVATLSFVTLVFLYHAGSSPTPGPSSSVRQPSEDFHKIFESLTDGQRCLDDDDPPQWKSDDCQCLDPAKPFPRKDEDRWYELHKTMVQVAASARDIDVALLGDSITQRWMGTIGLGRKPAPEYKTLFEAFFDKRKGAELQGVALGTSGDISPELLWHLENNMLPPTLQPKVFFLLIGTNDLGNWGCSKRNALAGILNIAQYLHEKRPKAAIVVHGILPRSDIPNTGDYSLGMRWKQILWINGELKRLCALHEAWYYMDSSDIFLERDKESAEIVLNADLMADSLHPNVAGYEAWGPKVVEHVSKVLKVHSQHLLERLPVVLAK